MRKYRPDIDGLRAVAVLPVVLFHANLGPFHGGFVGVDVFFVISGYLITSIILSDISESRFSIKRFYERRIRRIFPALFVVIAFCFAVGYFILASKDFHQFGMSSVAATLFASNFYFYRKAGAGYFQPDAAELPLLHTWSLAVEEQFYLFFPLLLVLIHKVAPQRMRALIAFICLASFAFSAATVGNHTVATFYLGPMRAWELLVGAMIALNTFPPPRSATASRIGVISGVAMIAVAVFAYSSKTLFPGPSALLPVIGTALVIWGGDGAGGSYLGRRPLVYVGQLSYSLYLWHVPLFAFTHYTLQSELDPVLRVTLVAMSFGLAMLSLKYVERPFRDGTLRLDTRAVLVGGVATMTVFAGLSTATILMKGWPGRFEPGSVAAIADAEITGATRNEFLDRTDGCGNRNMALIEAGNWCFVGSGNSSTPHIAVWGDSHAIALLPGIDEAGLMAGESALVTYMGGCPPFPMLEAAKERRKCFGFPEAVLDFVVRNEEIHTVVLIGRWNLWKSGHGFGVDEKFSFFIADEQSVGLGFAENGRVTSRGLDRLVAALHDAGKAVWIVAPVPEAGFDVPREVLLRTRHLRPDGRRPSRADVDRRRELVSDDLADLQRKYGVGIIYPHKALCGEDYCEVEIDGKSLYLDDDHLSDFGARSIASTFMPAFE